MTPRIATDRLDLVPLRPDDADEMAGVLADPSLYAFIGGEPPTLDELRVRFPKWAHGSPRSGEDWHNWIIRLRADGAAIGHLQATVIDDSGAGAGSGSKADVAWLVGTAWQGRGYASEAARALVAWLESIGVAAITAHIERDHAGSGRVAAAAGLTATGEIEEGEVVWRRGHRSAPSPY